MLRNDISKVLLPEEGNKPENVREEGLPVQQQFPLTSVQRPLLPTEAAAQTRPVVSVIAKRPSVQVPAGQKYFRETQMGTLNSLLVSIDWDTA